MTTYAGLASVIIALVFLYFIASIFVYGGELNAAIIKAREIGQMKRSGMASSHTVRTIPSSVTAIRQAQPD